MDEFGEDFKPGELDGGVPFVDASKFLLSVYSTSPGRYIDPATGEELPSSYSVDPTDPDSPLYKPHTSN